LDIFFFVLIDIGEEELEFAVLFFE